MSAPDKYNETDKVDTVLGGRQLVYSTTNFIKYPLEQALRLIAAGGFRNVEIWGNVKHLDPRNEKEDAAATASLSRELGLNVASIHAPFTLEHDSDPGSRTAQWEKLVVGSMEHAVLLGAHTVVVHPLVSGTDDSEQAYNSIIERAQSSLLRLADQAGSRGLNLAIENMPAHRIRRWGREVSELFEFVQGSGRDNLGICLDTGHVVFNNGDPVLEFELFSERIFSVHMNDNIWGMHMDLHLVPGTGSVQWPAFRQLLASERFGGMIVLELDSRGRPGSIFEEARKFTREFFIDGGDE